MIGILGGMGSGKSTVAHCFARLGCEVIDADVIAHDVLRESDIVAKIVGKLGIDTLDPEGQIDRTKLAHRVFSRPYGLFFLNQLIHPRVLQRCQGRINALRANPDIRSIVLDMPLLLEVGWDKRCDFLVFVDCDEQKKRQRIKKNGKIDAEQIKKREKFQISLDKKKQKAHYVINNNSDESELIEQVAKIFSIITGKG
ncbi:MAG: dephospho-CoA kinase [Planctomycetales bacterium]|nr:dephospho-CoA kinase [Planctomycetales bacterium]